MAALEVGLVETGVGTETPLSPEPTLFPGVTAAKPGEAQGPRPRGWSGDAMLLTQPAVQTALELIL